MGILSEEMLAKLKATPNIPDKRTQWGKIYRNTCPCGGTITASRDLYSGHLHASCDKCEFRLME